MYSIKEGNPNALWGYFYNMTLNYDNKYMFVLFSIFTFAAEFLQSSLSQEVYNKTNLKLN